MNLLLTGASGFIGQALQRSLPAEHQLYLHFRREPRRGEAARGVVVRQVADLDQPLDAVINLAGENLSRGRWTEGRKAALRDSRIAFTRELIEGLRGSDRLPRVWINASAVGWYGLETTGPVDETAAAGTDFAACLCRDWEAELATLPVECRTLTLRLGVVLGPQGGLLRQLKPLFWLGLGTSLGPGTQHMPWVALEDVSAVILQALSEPEWRGVANLVAPQMCSQNEFADTLARTLNRPRLLRAPGFALRLMLGEMADIVLADQRVQPAQLQKWGYRFRRPELSEALSAPP